MNARTALLAVALTATAPAFAGDNSVAELAEYTGLSERQVQMIIGNRTPFAEYTRSYNRSLAQFKRALGDERVDQLLAGEPVVLERRPATRIVKVDTRTSEDQTL